MNTISLIEKFKLVTALAAVLTSMVIGYDGMRTAAMTNEAVTTPTILIDRIDRMVRVDGTVELPAISTSDSWEITE